MNAALKACLLLAITAASAFAQTSPNQQSPNAMNCPMMGDQMQKQMSTMMTDMRAMMEGANDPTTRSRMQAMHDRMSAMMVNMQKMHGRMMGPAPDASAKGAEPPALADR